MLFPKEAPWLDAYVHELVGFPNAKNDDQVDSTVFALAWSTPKGGARGWLKYYENLAAEAHGMGSLFACLMSAETTVWASLPATLANIT